VSSSAQPSPYLGIGDFEPNGNPSPLLAAQQDPAMSQDVVQFGQFKPSEDQSHVLMPITPTPWSPLSGGNQKEDSLLTELASLRIAEDPNSKHRCLCIEVYLLATGELQSEKASPEASQAKFNKQLATNLEAEVTGRFPVSCYIPVCKYKEASSAKITHDLITCYDCRTRQHINCYYIPYSITSNKHSCVNCRRQWSGQISSLLDYSQQLILLELENKRRVMMARQEQDSMTPLRSTQEQNEASNAPDTILELPAGWIAEWDDS